MGYGFDLKCAECDYGLRVFIGLGFKYAPQSVFGAIDDEGNRSENAPDWSPLDKPLLFTMVEDKDILRLTRSLLSSGAEPVRYWQALYVCPDCHRLHNRFYFQLEAANGLFEPDYWCPDCKGLLEQADFDHNAKEVELVSMGFRDRMAWHCPCCGAGKLTQAGSRFIWN